MAQESGKIDNNFPILGLMPKDSSGINPFLSEYPECDGRGTIVAIFDTGCDIAAEGLLKTSNGKVKFIDAIDTTGSGDVDMSLCVEAYDDNKIIGLTGRILKLNPEWKNPTNKWYIGIKSLYELSPGSVQKEIKADRSTRRQVAINKELKLLTEQIQILENEIKNDAGSGNDKNDPLTDCGTSLKMSTLSELKSRSEILKAYYAKQTDNIGPIYDCLLWHNGDDYCAVVDTLETGDLTHPQIKVLHDYAQKHEYDTFSYEAQLTYSIKIYTTNESYPLLSIVVGYGTHGTHVASIVGSYWGENDVRNGNSPGCQLISVKIGDSFLSSMESSAGILRGLVSTVFSKCDLINMSYGEATSTPNRGAIQNLINELVTKYGVIFVSSNGNEGPCKTTAGAPGGTSEHSISVAAAIDPIMMDSQYSIHQKGLTSIKNYHWSSRGPTANGQMTSISALGAAYASVPHYNGAISAQMNGTSMSSPACCGILATFLSYLKSRKYQYTPFRVRSVMERSAMFLKDNDIFAQGNGLINIQNMVEYYEQIKNDPAFDNHYAIKLADMATNTPHSRDLSGIYLRSIGSQNVSHRYNLSLTPQFPQYQYELSQKENSPQICEESINCLQNDNNNIISTPLSGPLAHMPRVTKPQRYDFARCVNFVYRLSDGSIVDRIDWVELASGTVVTNCTKNIPIMVHPQNLPPGIHFAWVQAVIAENDPFSASEQPESIGKVLFQVPITVIVPEISELDLYNQTKAQNCPTVAPIPHTYSFKPTLTPLYCPAYFLEVPTGASFATCTIQALETTPNVTNLWLSTNTLLPGHEDERGFELIRLNSTGKPVQVCFPVVPHAIMEFCLMLPWTTQVPQILTQLNVSFSGISIGTHGTSSKYSNIVLDSYNTTIPLSFTSINTLNNFEPKIVLNTAEMSISPTKFTSFCVENKNIFLNKNLYNDEIFSRDLLPHQNGMYGAIIEYKFKLEQKLNGSFSFKNASSWLYESALFSQIVYIYSDSTKLLHHVNDCFPARRYIDYPPGSYTAYVYIKHTTPEYLATYKNSIAAFVYPLNDKQKELLTFPIMAQLNTSGKLTATAITAVNCLGGYLQMGDLYKKVIDPENKLTSFTTFNGTFCPLADKDEQLHGMDFKSIGATVQYTPLQPSKKVEMCELKGDNKIVFGMLDTLSKDSPDCKALSCAVKVNNGDKKKTNGDEKEKGQDKDDEEKDEDNHNNDKKNKKNKNKNNNEDEVKIEVIKIIKKQVTNFSIQNSSPVSETEKYLEQYQINALKAIDEKTPSDVIVQLYNTIALPLLQRTHYELFQDENNDTKKCQQNLTKFIQIFNILTQILAFAQKNKKPEQRDQIDKFFEEQFLLLCGIFDPIQIVTQIGLYTQLLPLLRRDQRGLYHSPQNGSENNNNKPNGDKTDKKPTPPQTPSMKAKMDTNELLIQLLEAYTGLYIMFVQDKALELFNSVNIFLDGDLSHEGSYRDAIDLSLTQLEHCYQRYSIPMSTAASLNTKGDKKELKNLTEMVNLYQVIIQFVKSFLQYLCKADDDENNLIGYASLVQYLQSVKIENDTPNDLTGAKCKLLLHELTKIVVKIGSQFGYKDSQNLTNGQVEKIRQIKVLSQKNDPKTDFVNIITQLVVVLANWEEVDALTFSPDAKLALARPRRFC